MKEPTPRDIALMVLNGVSLRSHPLAQHLDDVFRRNPHIDKRDRAFISHLVQGVLRWRLRFDWIVEQAADFPPRKIEPPVLNILRLALFQIFFLNRVPDSAAVNEAVRQSKTHAARHVVPFVNGILRAICRQKDEIPFPDEGRERVHYLSVFHSYPPWLVRKWIRELPTSSVEGLLSAGNRVLPVTIRANPLKVDRTELIRRLADEGIKARPTFYSPDGIELEGLRGRVDELICFREGLFQVQDQAAQITSRLLTPQPGEDILDVCAGFGGKSTHLAELIGDNGHVLALDISHRRLVSLSESLRRLGLSSITSLVADASRPLASLLHSEFDKVMVDAPCSGLGVISRHPDVKWNKAEGDIVRLAGLQRVILNEAASILRTGGKMLYATCTISREENEEVVKACLEDNKDLFLEDARDHIPEWGLDLIDDHGFLKTFPHIHHMDGFFAALFSKK